MLLDLVSKEAMTVHTFHLSTGDRGRWRSETEASLLYTESSRPAFLQEDLVSIFFKVDFNLVGVCR